MLNSGNVYKYLDQCANGFWSCKRALTYNRPTIVVTGTRSVGKSTGVACFALLDFIVNDHKFFYLRRRPMTLRQTCKTFFANAIQIINQHTEFKIKGFRFNRGEYEIAMEYDADNNPVWKPCGKAVALSEEENYKSNVFSEYCTIIYDEFISKDPTKYLGTKDNINAEWDALMSFYQTVDRGIDRPFRNETRIFLLGNKSTIYNPICLTIGLADYVRTGARFTAPKGKLWVWENVDSVERTAEIEQSFAYQMSTQSVQDYAYKNKGDDTDDFIKRPQIARYLNTVKLKGTCYGIYTDELGVYFIDKPKDGYAVVSLDLTSHDGNDLFMIQRWTESPTMVLLTSAYKRGKLYFGDGRTQNAFLKYFEFMP